MGEVQEYRYVKKGSPDRIVRSPAAKVQAEYDGFKPAEEAEAAPKRGAKRADQQ